MLCLLGCIVRDGGALAASRAQHGSAALLRTVHCPLRHCCYLGDRLCSSSLSLCISLGSTQLLHGCVRRGHSQGCCRHCLVPLPSLECCTAHLLQQCTVGSCRFVGCSGTRRLLCCDCCSVRLLLAFQLPRLSTCACCCIALRLLGLQPRTGGSISGWLSSSCFHNRRSVSRPANTSEQAGSS